MSTRGGEPRIVKASVASVADFYDGLAADYHLVYGDEWDAAVDRQGASLDRLIREFSADARGVLDCSSGIGTQAIGLALRGYRVHGTDISERAVERARAEAERRGAAASFGVADMRDLGGVDGTFDVVISCDNAVPHLLDDADVRAALRAMRSKLRANGVLIVTIRDYDAALVERETVGRPLLVAGPPRRLLLRLHDWEAGGPFYTVRLIVLTETATGWAVDEHATRYRAITRAALARAAESAGFRDVTWRDAQIVNEQPVLTGRRR